MNVDWYLWADSMTRLHLPSNKTRRDAPERELTASVTVEYQPFTRLPDRAVTLTPPTLGAVHEVRPFCFYISTSLPQTHFSSPFHSWSIYSSASHPPTELLLCYTQTHIWLELSLCCRAFMMVSQMLIFFVASFWRTIHFCSWHARSSSGLDWAWSQRWFCCTSWSIGRSLDSFV